jgi:hypothetical protein
MADQAKLSYSSGTLFVTLDVLSVKGAAEPDKVSKFPGIIHELLDGSLAEQNAGARQNPIIAFQTMTILQRRQVVDWWLDTTRTLDSVIAAPGKPAGADAGASGYLDGSYKYKIVAIDNVGYSACGTISEIITSTGADRKIAISYTGSTNGRGYKIFRSIDPYTVWNVVGYSEGLTFTDTGDALSVGAASVYLAAVTPPSANSALSVVTANELEFEWAFETELARMLTMELRASSIFLTAAKFPV